MTTSVTSPNAAADGEGMEDLHNTIRDGNSNVLPPTTTTGAPDEHANTPPSLTATTGSADYTSPFSFAVHSDDSYDRINTHNDDDDWGELTVQNETVEGEGRGYSEVLGTTEELLAVADVDNDAQVFREDLHVTMRDGSFVVIDDARPSAEVPAFLSVAAPPTTMTMTEAPKVAVAPLHDTTGSGDSTPSDPLLTDSAEKMAPSRDDGNNECNQRDVQDQSEEVEVRDSEEHGTTEERASDDDDEEENIHGGEGRDEERADDDDDGNKLSDYELLRKAKIARNEAVLRELGLMDPNVTTLRTHTTRRRRKRKSNDNKVEGEEGEGRTEPPPPRRSRRLQDKPETAESTAATYPLASLKLEALDMWEKPKRRPRLARGEPVQRPTILPASAKPRTAMSTSYNWHWSPPNRTTTTAYPPISSYIPVPPTPNTAIYSILVSPLLMPSSPWAPTPCPPQVTTTAATKFPPNSARAIQLDVNHLVSTLLGQTLQQTGKAHVVEEAARIASSGEHGDSTISFNKYSGVQEWANRTAFLWINLGSPASDVINQFQSQGRRINWFGGSRMHPDSNATQSLLAAGSVKRKCIDNENGDAERETDPSGEGGGVVLWCRRHDPDRNSFEPYTCLGRLQLVSWDANSHPIEFLWELRDYKRLWDHPDEATRTNFRSLVQDYSGAE